MNIVIVESPAKAKTINKYLGSGYKVIPSYGHVRDLPSKDGSVEPDHDFAMHWDVDSRAAKVMREIADAVKKADKVILATDPDREGEAISWHILQLLDQRRALRKGVPVERVTFNAVTKDAVLTAMKHPRAIDAPLVEAYLVSVNRCVASRGDAPLAVDQVVGGDAWPYPEATDSAALLQRCAATTEAPGTPAAWN